MNNSNTYNDTKTAANEVEFVLSSFVVTVSGNTDLVKTWALGSVVFGIPRRYRSFKWDLK